MAVRRVTKAVGRLVVEQHGGKLVVVQDVKDMLAQ
jgi:hypothetical protein